MSDANGAPSVGATWEWYTPPRIFDALGLQFDLDAASPGADKVPWIPAKLHLTAQDNALTCPWFGRVWLNPPYGPAQAALLHRLAEHGDGVALVSARTDTAWWHASAPRADLVCFVRGRVSFIRDDGFTAPAQIGSALLAFGSVCTAAVASSGLGWMVTGFRPMQANAPAGLGL